MFAFENGRENHQRFQLARAVEYQHGQMIVCARLPRRGVHTAAVASPEHRRREPYLFKTVLLAVDRDRCARGLVMEKQALNRDPRIIDFLARLFFTEFIILR